MVGNGCLFCLLLGLLGFFQEITLLSMKFREVRGTPVQHPANGGENSDFINLLFNNLFYPFKHHLDQLIVGPEMFSANELNIRIKRPGIFYDLRDVL